MPDEIDLNEKEEAALEAAWEKLTVEAEQPTDEYVEQEADAEPPPPVVKPSPFENNVKMIRRDHRNVGKRVRINNPGSQHHGREGKVTGFRGDWGTNDQGQVVPWVGVWVESPLGPGHEYVWHVRGDKLEEV